MPKTGWRESSRDSESKSHPLGEGMNPNLFSLSQKPTLGPNHYDQEVWTQCFNMTAEGPPQGWKVAQLPQGGGRCWAVTPLHLQVQSHRLWSEGRQRSASKRSRSNEGSKQNSERQARQCPGCAKPENCSPSVSATERGQWAQTWVPNKGLSSVIIRPWKIWS